MTFLYLPSCCRYFELLDDVERVSEVLASFKSLRYRIRRTDTKPGGALAGDVQSEPHLARGRPEAFSPEPRCRRSLVPSPSVARRGASLRHLHFPLPNPKASRTTKGLSFRARFLNPLAI
jgi:hypothetical protein